MVKRVSQPNLQPFIELNEREKETGTKVPFKERYALVEQHFPRSVRLDWAEAFKDVDLFGRLIKDIMGHERRTPGPGPRSVEDNEQSRERLRQLLGDDFTMLPFTEAFNVLAGKRSIRNVAHKIGLGPHVVFALKHGKPPDLYVIEQVAAGFSKDPSYFVEYRMHFILNALGDHMSQSPETTVDLYKKIKGYRNNGATGKN